MNLGDEELTPLTQKNSHYEPTQQELIDYAQYIGFILPQDQHLLYIAHQGLKADLPQNWWAYGNKKGDLFYKDMITGIVQEQHPADQMVKEKYLREKKRLQLLAAEKEVIVEQNESDLGNSDVHRMLKTSHSQREQGKSYLKTEQKRIEENVDSERSMESVESMNEEPEEAPVSTNFYASLNHILHPEVIQLNDLVDKLGQKHSNRIQESITNMPLGGFKEKQAIFETQKASKFASEVEDLGAVIKQKQELLNRLTQERMRKEKEVIRIQQQFQQQKGEVLESYRKRLRAKLQAEKGKKEKEMDGLYQQTLKRQYKRREIQINGKHPSSQSQYY